MNSGWIEASNKPHEDNSELSAEQTNLANQQDVESKEEKAADKNKNESFVMPEWIVEERSEVKTVSDDRRAAFMKLVSDFDQLSFEYPMEINKAFLLLFIRLKILDDPTYKPFLLAILEGLEIVGTVLQPESIAAIIFARENSVSIAKAINIIQNAGIAHSLSEKNEEASILMSLFALCEIGKEAEKIALTIKRYNVNSLIVSRMSHEEINKLIGLYLKLKNAGIEITDDICSFVAFSKTDSRSLVVDSLIELKIAGILTNDLLKTLSVHQQQDNLRPISNLLIYLNANGITLTNEFINLAIQNGYSANTTIDKATKLIMHGVKPSIEVLTVILLSEDGTHVENLLQLQDQYLLPNALLILQREEEKESVLTCHSVVRVIECKNFTKACAAFVEHRKKIDFNNDYLIQCMLLRIEHRGKINFHNDFLMPCILLNTGNMDSVFKIFLSLHEHDISVGRDINALLLAFRTNSEDAIIPILIEKQRAESSTEIKQSLRDRLPAPLVDCVLSFFHASAVSNRACKIEQPTKLLNRTNMQFVG